MGAVLKRVNHGPYGPYKSCNRINNGPYGPYIGTVIESKMDRKVHITHSELIVDHSAPISTTVAQKLTRSEKKLISK